MKSFRAFIEDLKIQERVWFRDEIVDMALRQQKLDAMRQRVKKKRQEADGSGDDSESHYIDIPE